jgi:hypothetical protein
MIPEIIGPSPLPEGSFATQSLYQRTKIDDRLDDCFGPAPEKLPGGDGETRKTASLHAADFGQHRLAQLKLSIVVANSGPAS